MEVEELVDRDLRFREELRDGREASPTGQKDFVNRKDDPIRLSKCLTFGSHDADTPSAVYRGCGRKTCIWKI